MTIARLHVDHGDYLLKCLHLYGVPKQECEDVRQDIYYSLLKKGVAVRDTQVRGFCSKIARNATINWLKKDGRAPTMEQAILVDEEGFSGIHPDLTKLAMKRWEGVIDNPNIERIQKALELAQEFVCDAETNLTAYELVADLLYGLSMEEVGQKYDVDKRTIKRWLREWRLWIARKSVS